MTYCGNFTQSDLEADVRQGFADPIFLVDRPTKTPGFGVVTPGWIRPNGSDPTKILLLRTRLSV